MVYGIAFKTVTPFAGAEFFRQRIGIQLWLSVSLSCRMSERTLRFGSHSLFLRSGTCNLMRIAKIAMTEKTYLLPKRTIHVAEPRLIC